MRIILPIVYLSESFFFGLFEVLRFLLMTRLSTQGFKSQLLRISQKKI